MTVQKTIYRNKDSKEKLFKIYEKYSRKLNQKYEEAFVNTRYGKTHVLVGGTNAEPLVIFHGGNSVNPFDLRTFEILADDYQIIAPDTIGQPGRSDETVLSPTNYEYAYWANDLLDAMGIDSACFIGTSVGGGILMTLAAYSPKRIKKAVFIVPMGLGYDLHTMIQAIVRLAFPYFKYIHDPDRESLIKAVAPLFHDRSAISESWLEIMAFVYQNVSLSNGSFRSPSRKELSNFVSPSMLIAADNDILAPARYIIKNAIAKIPNLREIEIMYNCGHIIDEVRKQNMVDKVRIFLQS